MKAIRVPIGACPECWASFTWPEWSGLKPAGAPSAPEGFETRLCPREGCGRRITINVEAARSWDVWMPADEYYGLFPSSDRVPQEVPKLAVAAKGFRFGLNVVPRLATAVDRFLSRVRMGRS